jgi:hypothetical protein
VAGARAGAGGGARQGARACDPRRGAAQLVERGTLDGGEVRKLYQRVYLPLAAQAVRKRVDRDKQNYKL